MEETQKEKQAVPEPIDIITLLHDVLRGVKKLWWACLLLTVLCAAGSWYTVKRAYRPLYRAAASFTVATGSGGSGGGGAGGSVRRVQLRVLLQHRHGFAARAHVPVHTRKRALNGQHQAGARHGFYYSFAFGERSGGFQPVHADRDGRECRKHVECPERRYGLLPGGRTLRVGRH